MTNGEVLLKAFPQIRLYEKRNVIHVLLDFVGISDFDLYVSKEWWDSEYEEGDGNERNNRKDSKGF